MHAMMRWQLIGWHRISRGSRNELMAGIIVPGGKGMLGRTRPFDNFDGHFLIIKGPEGVTVLHREPNWFSISSTEEPWMDLCLIIQYVCRLKDSGQSPQRMTSIVFPRNFRDHSVVHLGVIVHHCPILLGFFLASTNTPARSNGVCQPSTVCRSRALNPSARS